MLALKIFCSPEHLDFSAFNFFAGGHPEVWRLLCIFYWPSQSSFFLGLLGFNWLLTGLFLSFFCFLGLRCNPASITIQKMSYGSIDGSGFGSRNPFGGPSRQGYQPLGEVSTPCCHLLHLTPWGLKLDLLRFTVAAVEISHPHQGSFLALIFKGETQTSPV